MSSIKPGPVLFTVHAKVAVKALFKDEVSVEPGDRFDVFKVQSGKVYGVQTKVSEGKTPKEGWFRLPTGRDPSEARTSTYQQQNPSSAELVKPILQALVKLRAEVEQVVAEQGELKRRAAAAEHQVDVLTNGQQRAVDDVRAQLQAAQRTTAVAHAEAVEALLDRVTRLQKSLAAAGSTAPSSSSSGSRVRKSPRETASSTSSAATASIKDDEDVQGKAMADRRRNLLSNNRTRRTHSMKVIDISATSNRK